mmetsp:Transcript_3336/g.11048  ORF Transcript_3336/g.11048 Transcript_3336/m.11048 type:complete len:204 (+) Transcript_3336:2081-2692(+)
MRTGSPSTSLATTTADAPRACAWTTLSTNLHTPRSTRAILPSRLGEVSSPQASAGSTTATGREMAPSWKGRGGPKVASEKLRDPARRAGASTVKPESMREREAAMEKVADALPRATTATKKAQGTAAWVQATISSAVRGTETDSMPSVRDANSCEDALGRAVRCDTYTSGSPATGVTTMSRSVLGEATRTLKYSAEPARAVAT